MLLFLKKNARFRYEHGVEKNVEVLDYSREKVTDTIRQLANTKWRRYDIPFSQK